MFSGRLCVVLWELEFGEPVQKVDILVTATVMSNKLDFISNSEIKYLLPAFRKLWQWPYSLYSHHKGMKNIVFLTL